jgi:hypothetical protein
VISRLEDDHPRLSGGHARDLEGELHRIGPRNREVDAPIRYRDPLEESLGQLQAERVGRNISKAVEEAVCLRRNGLDDAGVPMSQASHAKAGS